MAGPSPDESALGEKCEVAEKATDEDGIEETSSPHGSHQKPQRQLLEPCQDESSASQLHGKFRNGDPPLGCQI